VSDVCAYSGDAASCHSRQLHNACSDLQGVQEEVAAEALRCVLASVWIASCWQGNPRAFGLGLSCNPLGDAAAYHWVQVYNLSFSTGRFRLGKLDSGRGNGPAVENVAIVVCFTYENAYIFE
jgi:hypothetical protein